MHPHDAPRVTVVRMGPSIGAGLVLELEVLRPSPGMIVDPGARAALAVDFPPDLRRAIRAWLDTHPEGPP